MWREYYCLWPGSLDFDYAMFVRCVGKCYGLRPRMALLMPCTAPLSRTPCGASIIAFGLGPWILSILCLNAVLREYYCLWPGSVDFEYPQSVRYMARVLLP